ncbi:MAG: MBL fold metallo-hydrolase [Kordiimonadales bacterium]|nr:MAG: MBL fold metallo-hydrolase [Kordiimonadales bacterium]
MFSPKLLAVTSLILASFGLTSAGAVGQKQSQVSEKYGASTLFLQPWNAGRDANEPAFHSQKLDANTFVIRQSLKTSFEAPFLYLIFGQEKVLLIDTGAGGVDLRRVVDDHIEAWLAQNQREAIQLVVMHSHGHGDHVGGDASFKDRPDTVVVGHSPKDIAGFFGIENWPAQTASFDLGGRSVDIIPTPGHHPSHVMVFDAVTKALFSGDVIYPGRLYFQCGLSETYTKSMSRVAEFTRENDVRWLLGGHVEMKAVAGEAFASENGSRRGEHILELPVAIVSDIQMALTAMGDKPRVKSYGEFILFPHPADPRGKQPPNWCLN